MKQIDEDHLYVVYKVYGRDDMILYTYVFFDKVPEECNETCESWRRRGNVFYVMKALEYSDFANIHIGSTNAEVHAVDSLVDAQHHASHRLSVRGFARLAVSAYSKTKQSKPNPYFSPMGQGTHRSQRSSAHCMRPAISHAAGWNQTTAGLGFRNDRGRMGGISRPASSRPPRSRRSRSRRFSHATRRR